jgi:hypothetical protein
VAEKKPSSLLLKLATGLVVLAGLAYLFVSSLETARSEPYQVPRAQLETWSLVLEPAEGPNAPLLSLRTGIELVSNLFRQLFQRTMESMNTPGHSSIPIVLRGEFDRGLAARMTPDRLLAAAREAGLESGSHEPHCLVHRRISEPGSTRQVYVAVVTSPSIVRFREQLASAALGPFDAAAMTPLMFVGGSDPFFDRWLPLRAEAADCVAVIRTAE